MTLSASSPVSETLFALFQDAALQAALPGGMLDDVPEDPTYPFGWYEIFRETDARGMGTGGLPNLEVRTHIFSQYGGKAEAQAANRLVIGLLKDAVLAVDGYAMCGNVFYRETTPLSDQELNGVKVHEIVSTFELWVEEA